MDIGAGGEQCVHCREVIHSSKCVHYRGFPWGCLGLLCVLCTSNKHPSLNCSLLRKPL